MGLSTASDIVMDVLKPADPAAVREARQAFKAERAGPSAQADGNAATAAAAFDRVLGAERFPGGGQAPLQAGADTALHDSYRSFEAMVLQMFVQSMLPNDAEQVFGSGTAGEMWKGMMAEQLGEMIAKGGGVGIADYLSSRDRG